MLQLGMEDRHGNYNGEIIAHRRDRSSSIAGWSVEKNKIHHKIGNCHSGYRIYRDRGTYNDAPYVAITIWNENEVV